MKKQSDLVGEVRDLGVVGGVARFITGPVPKWPPEGGRLVDGPESPWGPEASARKPSH